jgi:hypothetical protein
MMTTNCADTEANERWNAVINRNQMARGSFFMRCEQPVFFVDLGAHPVCPAVRMSSSLPLAGKPSLLAIDPANGASPALRHAIGDYRRLSSPHSSVIEAAIGR